MTIEDRIELAEANGDYELARRLCEELLDS